MKRKIDTAESASTQLRNREVLRAEDFTDAELAAIAAAKVPNEFANLDIEIEDWAP